MVRQSDQPAVPAPKPTLVDEIQKRLPSIIAAVRRGEQTPTFVIEDSEVRVWVTADRWEP